MRRIQKGSHHQTMSGNGPSRCAPTRSGPTLLRKPTSLTRRPPLSAECAICTKSRLAEPSATPVEIEDRASPHLAGFRVKICSMTMPKSERERREYVRGIMRDIAREIWRLPPPRQAEVGDRLLSMLRKLEKENTRLIHKAARSIAQPSTQYENEATQGAMRRSAQLDDS